MDFLPFTNTVIFIYLDDKVAHVPWLVIIPSLAVITRTIILPFQKYSQTKSLSAITDEQLSLLAVGLAASQDETKK